MNLLLGGCQGTFVAKTKEALPVLSRARILRVAGVPVKQTLTGSLHAVCPVPSMPLRTDIALCWLWRGRQGLKPGSLRKIHAGRGAECSAALTVLAGDSVLVAIAGRSRLRVARYQPQAREATGCSRCRDSASPCDQDLDRA